MLSRFSVKGSAKAVVGAAVLMLLWGAFGPNQARAETRAYLLRGWFGVFSTGMDSIAHDLKAKGVKAEAIGHLSWKATVGQIVKDRSAGKAYKLALIGHSQGANNVIEMAEALKKHNIPVDLLVTLAPFIQDPVPTNVVRAVNFYQSPGWGAPLAPAPGFRGKINNVDMGGEVLTTHMTIDKSARVQAEVIRAVLALGR